MVKQRESLSDLVWQEKVELVRLLPERTVALWVMRTLLTPLGFRRRATRAYRSMIEMKGRPKKVA